MTNYAHSNALTAHLLRTLLLNSIPPNCCLQPLLIPNPHRHLRHFLLSLTAIPPYTALSVRPPPQPPPPSELPSPKNITSRRSSSQRTPSHITEFFLLSPLVLDYLTVDGRWCAAHAKSVIKFRLSS